MPLDQTTHPEIAMPMTAASVAQRRMGLKASILDNEGVPSALVSNEFSRGLWPSMDSEITLEKPVMLIRGELEAVIRHLWLQLPG